MIEITEICDKCSLDERLSHCTWCLASTRQAITPVFLLTSLSRVINTHPCFCGGRPSGRDSGILPKVSRYLGHMILKIQKVWQHYPFLLGFFHRNTRKNKHSFPHLPSTLGLCLSYSLPRLEEAMTFDPLRKFVCALK